MCKKAVCKKAEKGKQGGVLPTHHPVDAVRRPPLIVIGGW